jgi:hypothetical protein
MNRKEKDQIEQKTQQFIDFAFKCDEIVSILMNNILFPIVDTTTRNICYCGLLSVEKYIDVAQERIKFDISEIHKNVTVLSLVCKKWKQVTNSILIGKFVIPSTETLCNHIKLFNDGFIHHFSNHIKSLVVPPKKHGLSNKGLKRLTNLLTLDLKNSRFFTSQGLFALTNLKKLVLDWNFMVKGKKVLYTLRKLETLSLVGNYVIKNENISILTNLTNLKLYSNNTINGTSISVLTNLRKLSMGSGPINKITHAMESSGLVEHIRQCNMNILDYDNNDDDDRKSIYDKSLQNLSNLQSLKIINFPLVRIWGIIGGFAERIMLPQFIKSLFETSVYLSDISILRLSNTLTTLELSNYNSITDESVQHLTNLTKLKLRDGVDTITDKSIQKLTQLLHLDLERNGFITDTSLYQLTLLNTLNLNTNNVITDDAVKRLTNLTNISLSYNNTITDHGIFYLTKLISLYMIKADKISINTVSRFTNLRSIEISIKNRDMFQVLENLPDLNSAKCIWEIADRLI